MLGPNAFIYLSRQSWRPLRVHCLLVEVSCGLFHTWASLRECDGAVSLYFKAERFCLFGNWDGALREIVLVKMGNEQKQ